MFRKLMFVCLVCVPFLFQGCSKSYGKRGFSSASGYEDHKKKSDGYSVSYTQKGTLNDTFEKALLRASEIMLKKGFESFSVSSTLSGTFHGSSVAPIAEYFNNWALIGSKFVKVEFDSSDKENAIFDTKILNALLRKKYIENKYVKESKNDKEHGQVLALNDLQLLVSFGIKKKDPVRVVEKCLAFSSKIAKEQQKEGFSVHAGSFDFKKAKKAIDSGLYEKESFDYSSRNGGIYSFAFVIIELTNNKGSENYFTNAIFDPIEQKYSKIDEQMRLEKKMSEEKMTEERKTNVR